MNFKSKIILSSFISILIIFILSGIGFYNSSLSLKNFSYFKDKELVQFNTAFEIQFLDSELTALIGKMIHLENTSLMEDYNSKLKQLDEKLIFTEKNSNSDEETNIFKEISIQNDILAKLEDEIILLLNKKEIISARKIFVSQEYSKSKKKYSDNLQKLYEIQKNRINSSLKNYSNISSNLNYISIISGLILTILSLFVSYKIYIAFKIPIQTILESSLKIIKGDLTIILKQNNNDEFGDLTNTFNILVQNLNQLIKAIQDTEKEISSVSKIVLEESKKVQQLSENQAASSEEISVSVNEITSVNESFSSNMEKSNSSISQINEKINSISDSSSANNEILKDLNKIVLDSKTDIQIGNEDLNSTLEAMNQIKISTSKINEFTAIISDISDRTNLLSLNASIEAARAGDYGRGFAVVASEITKLAENTIQSVGEVKQTVKTILQTVELGNEQVKKISTSLNKVDNGVTSIEKNSNTISVNMEMQVKETEGIQRRSNALENFSNSLKDSLQEQQSGLESISSSIDILNDNAIHLSEYSNSLQDISEKLNSKTTYLKDLVSHYQT